MTPEVITAINVIVENHEIVDAIILLLKLYDGKEEKKHLEELPFPFSEP